MAADQAFLKQKLGEFREHRAKAALIATRGFRHMPGHPHGTLDATEKSVRDYCWEMNTSTKALNDANEALGREKADQTIYEPRVCECCAKTVVDLPEDVAVNKPFGTAQYDTEAFRP